MVDITRDEVNDRFDQLHDDMLETRREHSALLSEIRDHLRVSNGRLASVETKAAVLEARAAAAVVTAQAAADAAAVSRTSDKGARWAGGTALAVLIGDIIRRVIWGDGN